MSTPRLVVNLWGHLSGGFGLGEGARATARALEAAGVLVQWCDLPLASHANTEPIPAERRPRVPATVDLIHTNPNVLRQTDGLAERLRLEAPLRVGYWAWELEAFPHGWERGFTGLDEIWCPSAFTATSLGQRSPVPVVPLPHLLNWPRAERLRALRAATAPRQRPFTCLFAFDFWSTIGRKNPYGVIDAFQQAFPQRSMPWIRSSEARLLLKLASSEQFPDATAALQDRVAGDPRIQLITGHLPADDFDALYAQTSALVSLHRAEGFGLSLAEAMAAGIPVVATGYSGNLDFMPPGSGVLVPYDIVPIARSEGDYRAGCHWAEPDLEEAARQLRQLAEAPDHAAALGQRGRCAVQRLLSPQRLASIVQQRLGTLLLHGGRAELFAALGHEHPLKALA